MEACDWLICREEIDSSSDGVTVSQTVPMWGNFFPRNLLEDCSFEGF